MAHIGALARDTPGVAHTVGISGQSLILNANAPNLGSMYVMLKEFGQRRGPGLTADAIAVALQRALPARGARGRRGGVRRAADRRPGHDRRLQDDHRGPRQPGPGRAAAASATRSWPGQRHAGLAGAVQQLPGEHALAVPRHRPDQVHGPGRVRQRRLQRLAGLPGLLLRQQLQRVRPDLAGEHPGRPALPRPGAGHRAASGAQQPGADGAAGHRAERARHQRAGHGDALQHVLRHRHHRQHRARHQLRPGHRPDARARRQRNAAGRWRRTGPS